jgi:hypothetical protein
MCGDPVLVESYQQHCRRHPSTLKDLEVESHIQMPPEVRCKVPLERVPRFYFHPQCGATTTMPEDILRTYLRNPYKYGSETFCVGCQDYVWN